MLNEIKRLFHSVVSCKILGENKFYTKMLEQREQRIMKPKILFSLYLFLCCIKTINAEVYTALAEMEELLETEAVLISNLEGFIRVQQDKLDYLKTKMQEYQREHEEAATDISVYVSNPINAYLLTKRLTTDWRQVENLMAHDVGIDFLDNITNYRNVLKFPSDEDLNGAAVALMRLQDTYNLDTSSVARGELNGIQYSTEMSSDDCFELGRQSYVNHDYYHTVLWMKEAMSRMREEPNNRTQSFTKADVLEYLAFSTYKQGNVETALLMTNELLQLIPNHERANGNKVYYEKELKEITMKKRVKGDDGSDDTPKSDLPISKAEPAVFDYSERKTYELLCQGKLKPTSAQLRSLSCRYVTNEVPFLKIGPFKLEEASKDPYIVIYHDAMYDSEIEIVKRMAKPRFRRATVQNAITGELETANYRISKSAWLKTEEHSIIANIVQRTEDMTGLDMLSAEELQVVNYGIGGHYEPHFDFARREEVKAFQGLNTGNRIATVLFYMSDVEQGGATVFTAINIALRPRKGTAAFWFNLHKSGEGDYRTRHAACPVLTGSKWVSNKWIHERRQEFRRPCGLEPDHGEFAI
ncbi:prolyl 4-hydroxylase subunit alpha-1-like isoform 2-T2 [Glossina fuscipes fuscipes]